MELTDVSEISEPDDLLHGGEHVVLDQRAPRQQRNVQHNIPMDDHEKDHNQFLQTLQNRILRVRQGTQKYFSLQLHEVTNITHYLHWTNRKPPRLLFVSQPMHWTLYQTPQIYPSSCPDAHHRLRPRAHRSQ